MGVEVLYGSWYARHWEDWLKDNGQFLNVVLLSRPPIVKKYLKGVQQFTKARLFYYCHDLHFLREERRLQIPGEKAGPRSVKAIRNEELNLMREMDMVLHCSHEEIAIIKQALPGKDVRYVPPYVIDVAQTSHYDPAKRNGLLFVGGFNHLPNVDAVLWFSRQVFPNIRAQCPEIVFHVVGSNPPKAVKDLAGAGIAIHADVDDKFLRGLYQSARLALVPLRYGAGVKGKTVEAMGWGLPVASTSCGLEGLPEEMRKASILCGDDEDGMSSTIVSVYNDPALLIQASAVGREVSQRWFSRAGMRQNWESIINEQLRAGSMQLPQRLRQASPFISPGFIQSGATIGIYPDGWLSPCFVTELDAEFFGTQIEIEGWLPDYASFPIVFTVFVDGRYAETLKVAQPDIFIRRFLYPLRDGQKITLDIIVANSFSPARLGRGTDDRQLAFILRSIALK